LDEQKNSTAEVEKRALRSQRIILIAMLVGMLLPFLLGWMLGALD
jgi:hypothetical protein